MLFFLILGVLLGAVTVVFALQNITSITVTFLAWQLTGSLSVVLLIAVATGVLICLLFSISEVIKSHLEFSALKKVNRTLQDENASYKRIVGDVAKVSQTKVTETTSVSSTS